MFTTWRLVAASAEKRCMHQDWAPVSALVYTPGSMRNRNWTAELLVALVACVSSIAWSAPTLIEHVQGYTLAANRLQSFSGLVFEAGKVLETGDDVALRKK